MLTFYNEHHAQHRGSDTRRGDMALRRDTLERAGLVLAELQRRGLGEIVTPHRVPLVSLERVHSPRYLHFLRSAWSEWTALDPGNAGKDALPASWPIRTMRSDIEPDSFAGRLGLYSMDSATPLMGGTWNAVKTGADCAINAAHALRLGERGSFALTRPPGHHAGFDFFGGGCYLNNAALAAQHLLDDGLKRVAILDLDYHHGNGTQGIFYNRGEVLCVSLHADPRAAYPYFVGHADETGDGGGHGHNINLPLAPGSDAQEWMAALETACIRLGMFAPEALVVALGVNTAAAEPGGGFGLQGADFLRIGERIAWLGLPAVFVLEGGQAGDVGINTVNVLEGFETAA
ncbi:histone deacetylase family protein [Massilia sp. IC2-278]|uniref:histone deacetylase family protein n=1 Tax=Massilia sp. IC2-278 TaxID=2887200 RepID=UPI001E4CDF78|nr:histone deacetylase family protein [Massilia sp. IC2-278]MCC2960009.1 histone deacetylase family protein [Massilia sp. IC2-278]